MNARMTKHETTFGERFPEVHAPRQLSQPELVIAETVTVARRPNRGVVLVDSCRYGVIHPTPSLNCARATRAGLTAAGGCRD
jgi:hypothetical protein